VVWCVCSPFLSSSANNEEGVAGPRAIMMMSVMELGACRPISSCGTQS
jgi:hypothetical protein